MKVYAFGKEDAPAILLLPGTFCHWRGSFGRVIPLLEPEFRVLCASYDGFDETEPEAVFPTMLDETLKLEGYVKACCGGRLRAAYGCSLGGSFVGLLAARQNIALDIGILGSSDLDQASPVKARALGAAMVPLVLPLVREGRFGLDALNRRFEAALRADPAYMCALLRMLGAPQPHVTARSCYNQFVSDLITPLPDAIDTPTQIHVFYALQMGEQYRARYVQHFAHPVLHEQPLRHEELLACRPAQWAALVKQICL